MSGILVEFRSMSERAKAERSEETVTLLRTLLDEAEAGTVVGIVVLVETVDGEWVPASARVPDRYKLVGLLEAWKRKLLDEDR